MTATRYAHEPNQSPETSKFNFLVTHNEINEKHGSAILIQNIFSRGKGILTIRSLNDYDGTQTFGDVNLHISHRGLSRTQIPDNVRRALNGREPERILCIPYYRDDISSCLAIKNLFNVPLCTYLMDDQNITVNNIPDDDLSELLRSSELCLGISREMCQAYEAKYQVKFWFVPPVVESSLIGDEAALPDHRYLESDRGILVGNIWSQRWLERLQLVIKESGASLDWFGARRNRLEFEVHSLQRERIRFHGLLPPSVLAKVMRQYRYAVVPTGSTEDVDDRPELTRLSLPSRIPFILATSHTPIVVMGTRNSAAARFVERFQIGLVCEYATRSFLQTGERICSPGEQARLRHRARELAKCFSAHGLDEWIWSSLDKRQPHDSRFERL